ncbi:MAG: BolA family transcriptional regulator [Limibacillus sp.]|jgi:BolA protein
MSYAERIETKLTEALKPTRLSIRDDSHRHQGHAGYKEGGETHFHVEVVSPSFEGLSRVARQRKVYELLSDELAERVHALELVTRTPDEDPA